MSNKTKISVVLLAASAAFFMSLENREGNVSKPYRDTGGVVTQGIGSTKKPDGTKIKMTDPAISKQTARDWARAYVSKDEIQFRKSLAGVKLSQTEYDLYLDFSYQYGTPTFAKSSMLRYLKAGQYKQACTALLKYKYVAGYDCSTPGNKRCAGVWTRQLSRYHKCAEVNS